MAESFVHIFRQGPMLATIGRLAVQSARSGKKKIDANAEPVTGEFIEDLLSPRSPKLVRDYIRHVGGDPKAYRGTVPAHMFHQWGFPYLAKVLQKQPYNLSRVLNAGCSIQMNAPLPADESLHVKASLESVDDNGRRAILAMKVTTETKSAPDALVCGVQILIPLASGSKEKGKKKDDKVRVPDGARDIDTWKLSKRSGLDFAILTGDFNPLHWIRPYARLFGLPGTILHGFSQLSRVIETLNQKLCMGKPDGLEFIEVRFTKPLAIPAKVRVYLDDEQGVYLGPAPGGPTYLSGTYKRRMES